jgi:hypothetical protein
MQNFVFTAEEVELLRDVLEHSLSELEVEVFRTDTHEFKEKLKHRRGILDGILAKLTAHAVVA